MVTVNICDAAEKIEDYPEVIQKLVWRALHYQCEIETIRSESLRSQPTAKDNEKLTKYIEVFRRTQQMIMKRQKLVHWMKAQEKTLRRNLEECFKKCGLAKKPLKKYEVIEVKRYG